MDTPIGKLILMVAGYLIIFVSLLPLVRNNNWVFRVFEYPRAQKLAINIFIAVVFVLVYGVYTSHDIIFASLLSLNFIYLLYQIWPYTPLGKNQMKKSAVGDGMRQFSLLIFNVYQDNRDVISCLRNITEHNPDIVLLVETDHWWKKALDEKMISRYPHVISRPLENTYGMLLYSRFELMDPEVRFLLKNDVPSIRTLVKLPSGDIIRLFGLHPQPPVPQENPRSTDRDAEILIVAKEARTSHVPVVVAGDLNDVAWSYTTELFLKVSGLLDPRRGRGFYNTFHAKYWFLRWPLDHVFCSKHFGLCNLQRLKSTGSDHFAMLISLCIEGDVTENQNNRLEADAEDISLAEEKIQEAM
jgi:endonuclease/exonuclease/phosphatase (EEP) superfamily protein YafD